MPNLSCRACGRQIYTVAPLRALFAEERRCPRCGANLFEDRRVMERRSANRRLNPANDPGPPGPKRRSTAAAANRVATDDRERRVASRRVRQRRGSGPLLAPAAAHDSSGWQD